MKYKYREYESGLRLFVAPREDTQAVTVMVLVGTGSNHEKSGEYGLAHFLEHMCFKGTTRRPNAFDVASELDALGAQYNAFTSNEKTGYYIKARKDHLAQIVDVISDIYLNSTFPEAEMQKEKGVVIEEIRMRNDDPGTVVYEEYLRQIHGEQSAGRPITGSVDSVKNFTQKQLQSFHKKHYGGSNTVIVISGAVDTRKAYRLVESKFADVRSGKPAKVVRIKKTQQAPNVGVVNRATDQAHLLLGFRAIPAGHKDEMTLRVLSTILGGSMSSRLFTKLREEMGVAYYVGASPEVYSSHGMLTLYAGVDKTRVKEVMNALLDEVKRLKTDLVWLGELERAQEYLLGHLALDLESSNTVALFLGNQALKKEEVLTPKAYGERIRAVTGEAIMELAQKIFTPKNATFAVIGPYRGTKQFEQTIAKYEW